LQDFDFVYPENVAYPIGGPGSARFLVVQLHYNNPELQSGMFLTVCVAHNYVYYLPVLTRQCSEVWDWLLVCIHAVATVAKKSVACTMLDLHRWDWQLWHWVLLYQYTTPAWCWNFVTWAHCEQVHDYTSKRWKLLYCGRVLCWVYQPGMEVKDTFVLWLNFGETIYTWVCRHESRSSVVKCPI